MYDPCIDRHHTDVFVGVQKYAQENGGWECTVDEYVDDTLSDNGRGSIQYDGVIARATKEVAVCARQHRLPIVNTWVTSPARDLPAVFADYETIGTIGVPPIANLDLKHAPNGRVRRPVPRRRRWSKGNPALS
jgi:hypothetical protein